jgi:ZIP family zinc transporter
MLFSSLYSMLPESKHYLKDAGWTDQSAGLLVVACFAGGFVGIQAVSRVLHQFMPSHVVDCDHTHHESPSKRDPSCDHHARQQSRKSRSRRQTHRHPLSTTTTTSDVFEIGNGNALGINGIDNGANKPGESTPLLASSKNHANPARFHPASGGAHALQHTVSSPLMGRSRATTAGTNVLGRRPSILEVHKRVMSFVKDTKCNCDESGSCYGFTDPCGQECFKHLSNRSTNSSRHPTILRTTTGPFYPASGSVFPGVTESADQERADRAVSPRFRTSRAASREPVSDTATGETEDVDEYYDEESVGQRGFGRSYTNSEHPDDAHGHDHHHHQHEHDHEHDHDYDHDSSFHDHDEEADVQHHHHVPANAFLSIGLQTSIAIALHKFPEGFITYATNHANPALGFNVFMALFVHNITEGFAMCLPLYMALGSRWRAMAWSAVLGGLSQPVGAGFAVLWFKLANKTHMAPNAVVYSCLFGVTAGIMVSVGLQLFVESLSLNHNRNLCIFFGFLGMALLGISNAFFAEH